MGKDKISYIHNAIRERNLKKSGLKDESAYYFALHKQQGRKTMDQIAVKKTAKESKPESKVIILNERRATPPPNK